MPATLVNIAIQILVPTLAIAVAYAAASCPTSSDWTCRGNASVCIPRMKWQDGVTDCPDGSDEECLIWQYDCKFGKPRCVDLRHLNDNSIDCMSGFDEACPAHFFVCMDKSQCIPPDRYLDGKIDCADASDEPCPAAHFLCHDRSRCIPLKRFQDQFDDCPDGSDEQCTLFQFECACGYPRCVGLEMLLDGKAQCADGSDEQSFTTIAHCADGMPVRNGTQYDATPPPAPPMVPCGEDHWNLCREDLNEVCLLIAGAPRCLCRQGHIRPPGASKCIPAPRIAEMAMTDEQPFKRSDVLDKMYEELKRRTSQEKKTTTDNSFADNAGRTGRLREKEIERFQLGGCDPNVSSEKTCPGKHELCGPVEGLPNVFDCHCDGNYTRHEESGVCVALIDECSDPELNDCDENALCMDNALSYECLCRQGYMDMSPNPQIKPGMNCLPLINECSQPASHDCSPNADCIDLPGAYACQCRPGYKDRSPHRTPQRLGRVCETDKRVNECRSGSHDCHPSAVCTDTPDGYTCRCAEGFVDVSAEPVTKPGRQCAQLQNECSTSTLNDCDPINGVCVDTPDGFVCRCQTGFLDANPLRPGSECVSGGNPCLDYTLHDCDRQAICKSSRPGFFNCRCPPGFVDASPDPIRFPGRICRQEENECALGTAECDRNADCVDTADGYSCRCRQGWTDTSPNIAQQPGRRCQKGSTCRDLRCAPEAECRETVSGPLCQCRVGFVDISAQNNQQQGHTCAQLMDECRLSTHDCSPNAQCIDTAERFTCRCHDGYRDESPNSRPGRVCVQSFVPAAPQCDVRDPLSCDTRKFEVCLFVDGTYKCQCPTGYNRLPDGRCKAINECQDARLNDCSADAQCIDTAESYSCQCNPGYVDVSKDQREPGRQCRLVVDECRSAQRFNVDCHSQAVCVDAADGYECRCLPGYADVSEQFNELPGRMCVQAINECSDSDLNDCSVNAICEDAKIGFTCRCQEGYVDASGNGTAYPGRICSKPKDPSELSSTTLVQFQLQSCEPGARSSCGAGQTCSDQGQAPGQYVCQCGQGFTFFEGRCVAFTACNGANDCDPSAVCSNVFNNFRCQCKPGYIDTSPDPFRQPGRVCKKLLNECANPVLNDCDPMAICSDARDGYTCACPRNYADVSSSFRLKPGRRCVNASNECAHKSLHSCDINADCVDTITGYECVCIPGFYDVSSSANLPHGRVCSVHTSCPKQATDLMFLVDGSGSIGTFTFKNEVLRFVREFVELFEIGPDNTRVGLMQYSEQIRHEFDLGAFQDKIGVLQGISDIKYMTGLTNTGLAIEHMVQEGFSSSRGARLGQDNVAKVAIVITDGRSQDEVSAPARRARQSGINLFVIGVTDHVKDQELEEIAGQTDRYFHVTDFTDLNTRLRSVIQKAVCPGTDPVRPPGDCDPLTQAGCDRRFNEICVERNRRFRCECPDGFKRHPLTQTCGGAQCNPNVPTTCKWPAVCKATPLGINLCSCPDPYQWSRVSGSCAGADNLKVCRPGTNEGCADNEHCERQTDGSHACVCNVGYTFNAGAKRCVPPDWCNPSNPDDCDKFKREECLPSSQGHNKCQCPPQHYRHAVTGVCLIDECVSNRHDCDRNAICTDTDDGFLCKCPGDFLDNSPDQIGKPGRVCVSLSWSRCDWGNDKNECVLGTHNCHRDATCTDLRDGYVCNCNRGFIDISPNPRTQSGIKCKRLENECINGKHDCDPNASCEDTDEAYKCFCNPGFEDPDILRNPGRTCIQKFMPCLPGNNDCDKNAQCREQGGDSYTCQCPAASYRDRSPDPALPGRVCIPIVYECDNPAWNDCDSPDRAVCTDTDDGYVCRCKANFVDISPDPAAKPGRQCQPLRNECSDGGHDCAPRGGICYDTPEAFSCQCAADFIDVSFDPVNRPGRQCKEVRDECVTGLNECDSSAECIDTEDSYICRCRDGFVDKSTDPLTRPGRRCIKLQNECTSGLHDCSPHADCVDTDTGFTCQCNSRYNDESPDRQRRPGRVCTLKLFDECRAGQHDCDPNARCVDRPDGFTCQCRELFIDRSPDRVSRPGRICQPKPTAPPPECFLERQDSCRPDLNEVCRLISGQPKCACPENYSRHSVTRACVVINECVVPGFNDCSPNAACIDKEDGFECRCKQGYTDSSPNRPGRLCEPLINECERSHLNDCHQYADCVDEREGYRCQCKQGYEDTSLDRNRPGRICQKIVNECLDPALNTCDRNALCTDELHGYQCACRQGFYDVSPSPTQPGRACKQIVNECANPSLNDCHSAAKCTDTQETYRCDCPANSRDISPNPAFPGRVCLVFEDECVTGRHDCDANANCRDTEESFTCDCKTGFVDRSPSPNRLGRVCKQLINECREGTNTCSPQAECRDLEDGYTCECNEGYTDRSSDLSQPGRICQIDVCPQTNDCAKAAVCEPKGNGDYDCLCIQGFVDRSPAGQRGRVCVRVRYVSPFERRPPSATTPPFHVRVSTVAPIRIPSANNNPTQRPSTTTKQLVSATNPCLRPSDNSCSRNAMCINNARRRRRYQRSALKTSDYRCVCKSGFHDWAPVTSPGHICERTPKPERKTTQSATPTTASKPTPPVFQPIVVPWEEVPITKRPVWNRQSDNECLDPTLNTCSRNAICYDLPQGYRCECLQGFVDRSPDPLKAGRVCETVTVTPPPPHPCQDPTRNDCHYLGSCRSLQGSRTDYTCECLPGHLDRSPDPIRKPGRICVPNPGVCHDPSRNDCDDTAICIPEGASSERYTCRCRDGYSDKSPNPSQPGRNCQRHVNECLDARLNDCAPNAKCRDLVDGYECYCPDGTIDDSPSQTIRPGRVCTAKVNECTTRTHNCSLFADCLDKDRGYECQCRDGYVDDIPTNPGRKCTPFFNECEVSSLNDCSRNADCIDERSGYRCQCRPPYRDESPDPFNQPGRICRYNECTDPSLNDCDPNASCQDTADSYSCRCNSGYIDDSPDASRLGRRCVQPKTAPTFTTTTIPPGAVKCGTEFCFLNLDEVCVPNPYQCQCRFGYARSRAGEKCVEAVRFILPLIVSRKNGQTLRWSSEYGNPDSATYVNIVNEFEQGIGQQFGKTSVRPSYITTDTLFINPPNFYNSSWQEGLMFNFSVALHKNHGLTDICELWGTLVDSLKTSNLRIGNGPLYIAADQPNVCPPPQPKCGSQVCDESLGEVCINNRVCDCPVGLRRGGPGELCQTVDPHQLMLWVVRDGQSFIDYNLEYSNPQSQLHRQYVDRFIAGLKEAYGDGALRSSYVTSDVNFIHDPRQLNGSWTQGLLYNFTVYLARGQFNSPQQVWSELISSCKSRNNQIGTSNLFIDPYQINPFSACFDNDCHALASCIERGPNSYTCRCPDGFLDDQETFNPGRSCIDPKTRNECERAEWNECHVNALCVDLSLGYECNCLPGFKDVSPPGTRPGTTCGPDFCSDVHWCPQNTTCKNTELEGACACLDGFQDIRASKKRVSLGLEASLCLHPRDVDECALDLTDCSGVATCTDLVDGYDCKCPVGYIDASPQNPGRVCGARLCGLCNGRGDCVHDEQTRNVTCACHEGFSGEFCEVAGADVRLVLVIILAILFLLLTLCCLCYFCAKCRCVRGRGLWYREPLFTYRKAGGPWGTLEHSTSSESGEAFSGMSSAIGKGSDYYPPMEIPRAKLRPDAAQMSDYLNQGAYDSESMSSEYTVREEIERRVITDTKRITHGADVHESSAEATSSSAAQAAAVTSSSFAKSSGHMEQQRERGQSEAAFSVGNMTRSSAWDDGTYNQDRAISEYTEDSEDTQSADSQSISERGAAIYDKKVLR